MDIKKRLLDRVVEKDGCWVWTGATSGSGYGMLRVDGRGYGAHRVAYTAFVGDIPDGLTIDHLCRNILCINPLHLEPVTGKENTLRGVGPTAINARKTHCVHGHPFTDENTYTLSSGGRKCKACNRANQIRRMETYRNVPRKDKPSKAQLRQLVKEHTWMDLARMFGVSDNAVRKWARGYGII